MQSPAAPMYKLRRSLFAQDDAVFPLFLGISNSCVVAEQRRTPPGLVAEPELAIDADEGQRHLQDGLQRYFAGPGELIPSSSIVRRLATGRHVCSKHPYQPPGSPSKEEPDSRQRVFQAVCGYSVYVAVRKLALALLIVWAHQHI